MHWQKHLPLPSTYICSYQLFFAYAAQINRGTDIQAMIPHIIIATRILYASSEAFSPFSSLRYICQLRVSFQNFPLMAIGYASTFTRGALNAARTGGFFRGETVRHQRIVSARRIYAPSPILDIALMFFNFTTAGALDARRDFYFLAFAVGKREYRLSISPILRY